MFLHSARIPNHTLQRMASDVPSRDLVPKSLKFVSGFSCRFAVHSGFFVLLVNKIREALFVFAYLPVEIGVILPRRELRRHHGFCAGM